MYIVYMAGQVQFDSVAEGRAHLKELLDAAARGIPAGLRRDREGFVVVDAARLRHYLAGFSHSRSSNERSWRCANARLDIGAKAVRLPPHARRF